MRCSKPNAEIRMKDCHKISILVSDSNACNPQAQVVRVHTSMSSGVKSDSHTTGNVPGQNVIVGQCCFEVDSIEH